jgi:hypothetical protein
MGGPSLRVRHRQPPQQLRRLAILAATGLQNLVPVTGHYSASEDTPWYEQERLFQDTVEAA